MITHNRAACKLCGEIIESRHRHDFVGCMCGTIAVDGGREYLRRVGNLQQFIEMSEVTE